MERGKIVIAAIVGITLISVLSFFILSKREAEPNASRGTTVVVLIDFSKSFAALKAPDGSIVFGLRNEDSRVLKAIAGSVAEMASRYWKPPVKVIWAEIQTSSIAGRPICAPVETLQKLIKPDSSVGTREEIESVLTKCAASVIQASKDVNRLSSFTDISGAIAMASDVTSGDVNERVIFMLSDFHEDLPRGTRKAEFGLTGERVILLHRPGTDEAENITGYMTRIENWKRDLLSNGAGSVVAMPTFATTKARLDAAMHSEVRNSNTNLTVMVDFKNNVSSVLQSGSSDDRLLVQIGQTLAEEAKDWNPVVTALWVAIGSSGFGSQTFPPIEFNPSLIKRPNELNNAEDFGIAMGEAARVLPNLRPRGNSVDIAGSLALFCKAEPAPASQVIVVISDFVDNAALPIAHFRLGPNTRVIMIHAASPEDRTDPNGYRTRRKEWERRFRESGASEVFQFPLASFTQNDLRSCFNNEVRK